jgi:hypothetical protein
VGLVTLNKNGEKLGFNFSGYPLITGLQTGTGGLSVEGEPDTWLRLCKE